MFSNQSSDDIHFANDDVQRMQLQSSIININQHRINSKDDDSVNVGDISGDDNVCYYDDYVCYTDCDDVYDNDSNCTDISVNSDDNSDDNDTINDNIESNFDLGVNLASWSTKCNIPRDHINQLLKILQQKNRDRKILIVSAQIIIIMLFKIAFPRKKIKNDTVFD